MAHKIHEWINYQPILFLNVGIHHIELIDVKHKLFLISLSQSQVSENRQRCQFILQNSRVIIISKRSCSQPDTTGRRRTFPLVIQLSLVDVILYLMSSRYNWYLSDFTYSHLDTTGRRQIFPLVIQIQLIDLRLYL